MRYVARRARNGSGSRRSGDGDRAVAQLNTERFRQPIWRSRNRAGFWKEAPMTTGAMSIAGERDRALKRLQVLAAEIRAHEQAMRRNVASLRRPADERLYRRLRQVNGGRDDRA